MIGAINAWFLAKDWRTWLSHILMAFVLAIVTSSAWAALWCYLYREVEQVIAQYSTEGADAVRAHALDHIMDVVMPFVALALAVMYLGLTP